MARSFYRGIEPGPGMAQDDTAPDIDEVDGVRSGKDMDAVGRGWRRPGRILGIALVEYEKGGDQETNASGSRHRFSIKIERNNEMEMLMSLILSFAGIILVLVFFRY